MHTTVLLPLDATGRDAWPRTRDVVTVLEDAGIDAVALVPGRGRVALEPVTTAAAVARATSRLGVLAFDAAGVGFPYNTARRLVGLDHVAGGRAGWFAGPSPRSVHVEEFVGVVDALWDTWEEGAERPDKSTGDFHDDTRIHRIEPTDPVHRVSGPLDTPRSPQGRPVVVADGRAGVPAWAGRWADVVLVPEGAHTMGSPRVAELVPGTAAALATAASRGVDGVAVEGVLDRDWANAFARAVGPWAVGADGTLRERFGLRAADERTGAMA